MKDAMTLEAFFSLAFLLLSLSLSITCAFPFTYKRGSTSTRVRGLKKTQLHSIFLPETWDLHPLSPIYNTYYKQVPVTRAAADWT